MFCVKECTCLISCGSQDYLAKFFCRIKDKYCKLTDHAAYFTYLSCAESTLRQSMYISCVLMRTHSQSGQQTRFGLILGPR